MLETIDGENKTGSPSQPVSSADPLFDNLPDWMEVMHQKWLDQTGGRVMIGETGPDGTLVWRPQFLRVVK